jgi:hypothetical protein
VAAARGVVADVPGGVELIHRQLQPRPKQRLELGRLARNEKAVEALEDRQVAPPGVGRHPRGGQLAHDPVDVVVVTSQAGLPQAARNRSSVPVPLPTVSGLNPRATWLAT